MSSPNLLQYLRLRPRRNLTTEEDTPEYNNIERLVDEPPDEEDNYLSSLKEFGGGQGPAFQALMEHVKNVPQRNKPSFGRKLAAGLIGGAATFGSRDVGTGMGMVDRTLYSPYYKALEKYKLEGQGLEDAARLEERSSESMRRYLNTASEILNRKKRTEVYEEGKQEQGRHWKATEENTRQANESEKEYRNRMARSAERRAGASERNAAAYAESVKNKGSKQPTPQSVYVADTQAIRESVRNNPQFAKFLDQNGQIDTSKGTEEGYQTFINDIERRKKLMLGGVPPVSNPNLPPDKEDEGEIIP